MKEKHSLKLYVGLCRRKMKLESVKIQLGHSAVEALEMIYDSESDTNLIEVKRSKLEA